MAEALHRYVVEPDPSIGAIEAGEALNNVVFVGAVEPHPGHLEQAIFHPNTPPPY